LKALLFQFSLRPHTAHDLEITMKASGNCGHEPLNNLYQFHEIPEIGQLPGLVGL
jgi:2-haloacid dehalogenase